MDKNITGFEIPFILAKGEDYKTKLKSKLEAFAKSIDRLGFQNEGNLINDVRDICEKIIDAFEEAKNNNVSKAEEIISEILREYKKYSFAVSELDKNYAFRGIAACEDLRQNEYEKEYKYMLKGDLNFFRARVVDKTTLLSTMEDISYLPFSKRDLAKNMRFSSKNNICLYLGVTSFVCAEECQWDGEKNLYLSSFIFNEKGKKLKILNLAISQSVLNGMIPWGKEVDYKKEFHNTMLKVFPLVIATSFTLEDEDEKHDEKDEYLLSQILMNVLQKEGVDGVAYLSRQGKDDFLYPQMVCLAIPVIDSNAKDEYGKLASEFVMTKPVLFENAKNYDKQDSKKSYINEKFPKYSEIPYDKYESANAKITCKGNIISYQDTCYSRVDNYLVNQVHENFLKVDEDFADVTDSYV